MQLAQNLAQNASFLLQTMFALMSSGMLRSISSMPTAIVYLGFAWLSVVRHSSFDTCRLRYMAITKYASELISYAEFRSLVFDCGGQPCLYPTGQVRIFMSWPLHFEIQ